ncbi:hypothetical protein HaLaN_30600 [Haematococcus lacustris]|uniref:Uncharacterized protein n=1 Tax=Haematococcus lacustris TaxID=44745 RepID=A0A6A0AI37_HAELA|nr:hypothetical protein HaLaN_30600 [Haematococcus lacustris]
MGQLDRPLPDNFNPIDQISARGLPVARRLRNCKVQLLSAGTNSKELRAAERRSIGGACSAGAVVSQEPRSAAKESSLAEQPGTARSSQEQP